MCIIDALSGDVPKWLKGPHSKCGRVLIAPREFKSLHLRQKRNLPQRGGFLFSLGVFDLNSRNGASRFTRFCATRAYDKYHLGAKPEFKSLHASLSHRRSILISSHSATTSSVCFADTFPSRGRLTNFYDKYHLGAKPEFKSLHLNVTTCIFPLVYRRNIVYNGRRNPIQKEEPLCSVLNAVNFSPTAVRFATAAAPPSLPSLHSRCINSLHNLNISHRCSLPTNLLYSPSIRSLRISNRCSRSISNRITIKHRYRLCR